MKRFLVTLFFLFLATNLFAGEMLEVTLYKKSVQIPGNELEVVYMSKEDFNKQVAEVFPDKDKKILTRAEIIEKIKKLRQVNDARQSKIDSGKFYDLIPKSQKDNDMAFQKMDEMLVSSTFEGFMKEYGAKAKPLEKLFKESRKLSQVNSTLGILERFLRAK